MLEWRRVCVVTSEVHAERAPWLLNKVLGPGYEVSMHSAHSAAGDDELNAGYERNARLLRQIQTALEDLEPGDDDAFASLLFDRHPGYAPDPSASAALERALL
jgi:hypothetical protein